MARRSRSSPGLGSWLQSMGEQIGGQLGQIISETVQRTVQRSVSVADIARRAGASVGNGRRAQGGQQATCTEPGCGRPVLAKGLCRSHYYRERYRAQKAGTLKVKRRGKRQGKRAQSRGKRNSSAAKKPNASKTASAAKAE